MNDEAKASPLDSPVGGNADPSNKARLSGDDDDDAEKASASGFVMVDDGQDAVDTDTDDESNGLNDAQIRSLIDNQSTKSLEDHKDDKAGQHQGHGRPGTNSAPASNADVLSLFRVPSFGASSSNRERSNSATLMQSFGHQLPQDDDPEMSTSSSDSEIDEETERQKQQRNSQIEFINATRHLLSEKQVLEEQISIEHEQLEDANARGEFLEGQLDMYKKKLLEMEEEKTKYEELYGKMSANYLELVTRHDELIEDRKIAATVAANVEVEDLEWQSSQSDSRRVHRRGRSRSLGDEELRKTLVHSWSPQGGQITLLQRELESKTEQLDAMFQKFSALLDQVNILSDNYETTRDQKSKDRALTDRAAIRRDCLRKAFDHARVKQVMEATNMLLESYIRRYPARGEEKIVENLERGEEFIHQLFYDELQETRNLCAEAFDSMNEKFEYFDEKMNNVSISVDSVDSMTRNAAQVHAKTTLDQAGEFEKITKALRAQNETMSTSISTNLSDFSSTLKVLREDVVRSQTQNDELNAKLLRANETIRDFKSENERLLNELEALKLSKCEAIRHVSSEMDRLRSQFSQLGAKTKSSETKETKEEPATQQSWGLASIQKLGLWK